MNIIWWTSRDECEAIGPEVGYLFPKYIQDQYRSRFSQSGRGRLWVDETFGHVEVTPWWPDTPMGRYLKTCAGIVVSTYASHFFDDLPGLLTTVDLQRVK